MRQKEPIELVISKGKKHLTKDEIEARRSQEICVPFKEINKIEYLNDKQQEKFEKIANMLLTCKIYTELDEDALARYVIAQDLYIAYTQAITEYLKKDKLDSVKDLQNLQDKAFKQAQASARDLGLTISSRCRLVVPKSEQDAPKTNRFELFTQAASE